MTRHVIDRRKSLPDGGRLRHFVEVERGQGETGAHPASMTLYERPKSRNEALRVREYLRIERGRTA
ncbi:hypothetical protein [Albidovulum sp.]